LTKLPMPKQSGNIRRLWINCVHDEKTHTIISRKLLVCPKYQCCPVSLPPMAM
jgi:hypothetical protein